MSFCCLRLRLSVSHSSTFYIGSILWISNSSSRIILFFLLSLFLCVFIHLSIIDFFLFIYIVDFDDIIFSFLIALHVFILFFFCFKRRIAKRVSATNSIEASKVSREQKMSYIFIYIDGLSSSLFLRLRLPLNARSI